MSPFQQNKFPLNWLDDLKMLGSERTFVD